MIAFHDASCGDVIYSIPLLKKLGVETLHLRQTRYKTESTFRALERLVDRQGITLLDSAPQRVDYDLTRFRKHPNFITTHLIQNYFDTFNQGTFEYRKWLDVIEYSHHFTKPFVCVNITDRYRDNFDWQRKIDELSEYYVVYFIGLMQEWKYANCQYIPTQDLYDVSKIFANPYFVALYCNPSACLTIAQGMDKKVYLREDVRIKNAHIESPQLAP